MIDLKGSVNNAIGIDVSKGTLDACLLTEQHATQISNRHEGLAELVPQLPPRRTCRIVCEAAGAYERLFLLR